MTIRQDMLRAASQAKRLLNDSADLVVNFVNRRLNHDGGFKGRSSQSDLYYTVFGIESLLALGAYVPKERILNYLRKFEDGSGLDIVHLACLARCWADISQFYSAGIATIIRDELARNIEKYRCPDGGYNVSIAAPHSSAYGCFLALGAYQDLNIEMQNPAAMADCIKLLRLPDAGYSNDSSISIGSTPATAAALTVLHYLNEPVDNLSTSWLLSRLCPKGGFTATASQGQDSIPDLLSTATSLHALALIGIPIDNIKERCLDFLDTLWVPHQLNAGQSLYPKYQTSNKLDRSIGAGFRGNWADDILDCEYTYYGLLSLGHLNG